MKRISILLFISLAAFTSCSKKADLKSFSWLSGKWMGRYDSIPIFEQWSEKKENAMFGRGGVLSNKDTVFAEKLKIEQRGDDLYYVAIVSKKAAPIDFKFTGFDHDTAVFESQEHDFPQRVLYFNNADGTFYSCVDGLFKGKYAKEEFNYKRMPE